MAFEEVLASPYMAWTKPGEDKVQGFYMEKGTAPGYEGEGVSIYYEIELTKPVSFTKQDEDGNDVVVSLQVGDMIKVSRTCLDKPFKKIPLGQEVLVYFHEEIKKKGKFPFKHIKVKQDKTSRKEVPAEFEEVSSEDIDNIAF
jgi:hypothetical protein